MHSGLCPRVLPVARGQLGRRFVSHSATSPLPRNQAADTPPTPTQIARFALTGTTLQSSLDKVLRKVFSDQESVILPPLWSASYLNDAERTIALVPEDLKDGKVTLRRLRLIVESKVNTAEDALTLQRNGCSFITQALEASHATSSPTEVMTTLHAVISRIERLGTPVSKELHILGMVYASLYLFPSALRHHLRRYETLSSEQLDPTTSIKVLRTLRYSLRYRKTQKPKYDMSLIREIVTGKSGECSLHGILPWDKPGTTPELLGQYFSLLVVLGSDSTLETVWYRYLLDSASGDPVAKFKAGYRCVATLVQTGKKKKAMIFLEQLSRCGNGSLPGLSKFKDLTSLLQVTDFQNNLESLAGTDEYLRVLQSQLEAMEKRLGVDWDPTKSSHISISDTAPVASEATLLAIDGESEGYGSGKRLAAEIQALGRMRSWTNLGKIGNLLDEYEGKQIPIRLASNRLRNKDLFWTLQRCPIKFPTNKDSSLVTNMAKPWTVSTLGLYRVRPLAYYHTIHEPFLLLMGLGYLIVGSKSSNGKRHLHETGHIVAWDRVFGQFLIVQTKHREMVNRHRVSHSPEAVPGLEDIARIRPPGCSLSEEFPTPFLGCQKQHFVFDIHGGSGISP